MSIREEINQLKKYLRVSTDRELAEILGTSKGNIDSWIKRDKIPEKWAIIIGQMYKKDSNTVDIPMLKFDGGAGTGIHNFQPQQTIISLNASYFPFVSSGKSAVIEIVGDSMEPDLLDGDYIIISPVQKDRTTEDGIYAIRIDGMVKVKNLHFRLDGSIDIISSNQKYVTERYDPSESQLDFEILGKKELRITRR